MTFTDLGPRERLLLATGLVITFAFALVPRLLLLGGVAPLVLAIAVAGLVGLPAALASWEAPVRARSRAAWAAPVLTLTVVGSVAAALAEGLGALPGYIGLPLLLVALGAGRIRWLLGAPVVLLALAAVWAGGTMSANTRTLLEPAWFNASAWWPAALTLGLLLPLPGLGAWSDGRSGADGDAPIRLAGLGVLTSLAAAIATALLGLSPDRSWLLLAGLAGLPAARHPTWGRGGSWRGLPLLLLGALLWWLGPGRAALPTWWASLLPVLLAALLADEARKRERQAWPTAVGAVLAAAAAIGGWPGLPGEVQPAVAVAMTVVALAWYVGLRPPQPEGSR